MNNIIWITVTLSLAVFGSIAAKKCRIPAGAMTGAILAVAVLNCCTNKAIVPGMTKPCLQIMGGALLGHTVSRNDLKKMRSIIKAAVILAAAMFLLNMTTGSMVFQLTEINLATAFLATAPGGVSDMALIAEDLGADMQIVSVLQLFRMFAIYLIFPPFLRFAQKCTGELHLTVSEEGRTIVQLETAEKSKRVFLTILCAVCGGYLVEWIGLPAGFMVGSVIASAALNIGKEWGYIPSQWRFFIQSATGAMIGCRMTKESLQLLGQLIVPVLIMIFGMLLFTLVFGVIMSRITELDFQTSLFCLTPGGIQETSLLAGEMGCDTSAVVVLHTVRLILVICVFPSILTILTANV